jgi:serine/threonine-protein kinase
MGVVYKVRQVRLNRFAALKMILGGELAGPEDAARFLGEAEAVARLHHPNIVQIFACGDHDGHSYFEMEYVAGGSLAERLDGTPWEARDAARLVETLARALHEVHRLGVVHRDLKPANVLMAADGTPKVADFGLAKSLDVESGLTRTDHVLGSPSYMGPEQAEGKAGVIGPAADVYSLGAVLYELLTGRPPFRAATALETLEQVKSAEPVAPRRLRSKLPRDLETICLKCLRKEPARRYDSAAELAEDLRRFGAGESIRARPVAAVERAWRWCRRKPALAALATALAAALVTGFLGVATQWWRAEGHLGEVRHQRALLEADFRREVAIRRALEEANAREQEARRRAQARYQLGMQAVDGYSALALEDELQKDSRLEGLRKRMLGSALKFYTELQESLEADTTPQALYDLSESYSRVGDVQEGLGSMHEALAAHRRALAIREALAAAQPANLQLRSALARAHFRIGIVLRPMGRLRDAIRSLERSLAIDEGLVRDNPTEVLFQEDLAWALHNLGVLQVQTGRPDEAVRSQERVLAIREAMTRVGPASPRLRSDLAWCQVDLGVALNAAGFPDEALRRTHRAAADLEELVRAFPSEFFHQYRFAQCLVVLGIFQHRAGALEAGRSIERSLAIREELARDFPNYYPIQNGLAISALSLSTVRAAAGLPGEALANIQRAEQIVGRFPDIESYTLVCMARAYAQYSTAARRGERHLPPADQAECKTYADRAMATLRRAVAAGYAEVASLRRDIDLDPLRPRRDFQELVMDLSFPADPFQR